MATTHEHIACIAFCAQPDTKMPYHRDQVIASVTDYYHFLTRLHVQPQDIRRPPQPDGWSEISQKRFSRLGKTEKVVDLLKHLPYVQNDYNDDPILIWEVSGCNDYTGRQFQQDIIEGDTANYTPDDTSPDVCSCDKLREPHPHIVPLASPAVSLSKTLNIPMADDRRVVQSWGLHLLRHRGWRVHCVGPVAGS